ncbi:hypothetical protein [Escherichia coli]|uniref:hypothetical protein n=1 Tax=Escherichia coli TaxID=562 RepID=UPI003A5BC318
MERDSTISLCICTSSNNKAPLQILFSALNAFIFSARCSRDCQLKPSGLPLIPALTIAKRAPTED